jgi:hypothetical protein
LQRQTEERDEVQGRVGAAKFAGVRGQMMSNDGTASQIAQSGNKAQSRTNDAATP